MFHFVLYTIDCPQYKRQRQAKMTQKQDALSTENILQKHDTKIST